MSLLTPHLLLRSDPGPSQAATLLRSGGYVVSKVTDDLTADSVAGASHIDGIVIELATHAAISLARRLHAQYGAALMVVVLAEGADAVRRALPGVPVLSTSELELELLSTVDLTLATHLMKGGLRAVAS